MHLFIQHLGLQKLKIQWYINVKLGLRVSLALKPKPTRTLCILSLLAEELLPLTHLTKLDIRSMSAQ
jgi:hypothetical protein